MLIIYYSCSILNIFIILSNFKIGQISIPLNILFNEKNGIFDGRVSFYGRVFGLFKCQIDFCLNEEEN